MTPWKVFTAFLALGGVAAAAELRVPADYATVTLALEAAASGDTVTLARGTYAEAVLLKAGVTVQGVEAAATILTGGVVTGSAGTLQRVTVTGTGLTFASSASGQALAIRNSVFRGVPGTALRVSGAFGSLEIARNTFYGNGTALDLPHTTGTVEANLFASNTWPIALGTQGIVRNNRFFANSNDGTQGTGALTDEDPRFVDAAAGDFHLQAGSPALGATLTEGQGAYSGPLADPVPARVTGSAVAAGTIAGTATVSWSPNLAHDISGYLVRFGPAGDAPLPETAEATGGSTGSLAITGLGTEVTAPAAPAAPAAFPGDESLLLRWPALAGASGYEVHWGTAADALVQEVDVGTATETRLRGLPNGTPHFAAVRAYGEGAYHFAVAARTTSGTVGADSATVRLSLARAEGPLSAAVSATPEAVEGYPDLPDRGGCFLPPTRPLRRALLLPLGLLALGLWGVWRGRPGVPALLLTALLAGSDAQAAGVPWVATAQVGALAPATRDWGDHYRDDLVPEYRLGVGLRPVGPLQVGVTVGYWEAEGRVDQTRSGVPLGERLLQTLRVVPVVAYLTVEGRVRPNQLVVPYLAGGVARAYYRQRVADGPSVRGHLSGFELRAGAKVLLDALDPRAARRAREGFALRHTYGVVEGRWTRLDDFGREDTDLGSWSLGAGLVLEF